MVGSKLTRFCKSKTIVFEYMDYSVKTGTGLSDMFRLSLILRNIQCNGHNCPNFWRYSTDKKKRNSTGIRLKNVFWNYIFNCFAVESDLNKRFCSLLSTGCTKRGNNLVVEGHMKIDGIVNFNT